MNRRIRIALLGYLVLMITTLTGHQAWAQVELSGIWNPRMHEDQPDRGPGVGLGDYTGLPINDAARLRAESWDASRLTLQEHQCRVHIASYIYRGPLVLRIWEERDPESQQLVAIRQYISTYEQWRTIWMDGRPHPPENALHTWMGFSTGKWNNNILTVTTTHIKTGWIRRNGTPTSDRAVLTEHFLRHGEYLTYVLMLEDPAYLEEPYVRTIDFVQNTNFNGNLLYPCTYVEEVTTRDKGAVPHYLPGENPFIKEMTTKLGIPAEGARGGAETLYPEFRARLKGAQ